MKPTHRTQRYTYTLRVPGAFVLGLLTGEIVHLLAHGVIVVLAPIFL